MIAGNTIRQLSRVTTSGESHGLALGCIVDGVPLGIPLTEADLQHNLDRRRPGISRYTIQCRESDQVKILFSVFKGVTTGTNIGLLIGNINRRPQNYSTIRDASRPGHANYTYEQEYGLYNYHDDGRSSACETAMHVAAGTTAKRYLAGKFGIEIHGRLTQMGDTLLETKDWLQVEQDPFFCPDPDKIDTLDGLMYVLKKGDGPIGVKVTVVASSVLAGLGEPVFGRLGASIAHALVNINAMKDVEIGGDFDVVTLRGSQNHNEITKDGFQSNHMGGVLGGTSSGQKIIAHVALKPISNIIVPGHTINRSGEEVEMIIKDRHDPCVGIRTVPIAEVVLTVVLMDHLLQQRAQNADVRTDIPCW